MPSTLTGNLEADREKGTPAASIVTNVKSITVMTLGALVHLAEDRTQWHKIYREVSSNAAAYTR